jgi:hypothetical protein
MIVVVFALPFFLFCCFGIRFRSITLVIVLVLAPFLLSL